MFWKKKTPSYQVYDVTQKLAKTWWGGTKLVPTTKAEERKMKADILQRDPNARFFDHAAKKQKELEWIDRIEEYDALFND